MELTSKLTGTLGLSPEATMSSVASGAELLGLTLSASPAPWGGGTVAKTGAPAISSVTARTAAMPRPLHGPTWLKALDGLGPLATGLDANPGKQLTSNAGLWRRSSNRGER